MSESQTQDTVHPRFEFQFSLFLKQPLPKNKNRTRFSSVSKTIQALFCTDRSSANIGFFLSSLYKQPLICYRVSRKYFDLISVIQGDISTSTIKTNRCLAKADLSVGLISERRAALKLALLATETNCLICVFSPQPFLQ